MSDEGDVADEAVADGAENADTRGSGGRTALVTKPVVRPQRPTGKRSRSRAAGADADVDVEEPSTAASEATGVAKDDSTTKAVSKAARAKRPVNRRPGRLTRSHSSTTTSSRSLPRCGR